MSPIHLNQARHRGSVLLATLFFIILLAVGAGAVFELTVTSYKLSKRNEVRAEARAVAESELEYLYFKIKDDVIQHGGGNSAASTPSRLTSIADNSTTPTTIRTVFSASQRASGWIVRRSVSVESLPDSSITWPITGILPNSTKTGRFVYLVAKIEIRPPASSPLANSLIVRVGRHAYSSTSSIFQYNVFAQGDLEFAPGGNTVIEGDIAANGSVFMASQGASSSLTLKAQIRFLANGYFNSDDAGDTIYRKIGTLNTSTNTVTTVSNANTGLNAPISASGAALVSGSTQLETMNESENLLGGLDAAALATAYGINDATYSGTGTNSNLNYTGLFGSITADPNLDATNYASQLATAQNQVYRSLLAPPPSARCGAGWLTGG